MLNYVWSILLVLGLVAAISTDVIDQSNNNYKNNIPFTLSYSVKDTNTLITEKQYDATFVLNTKTLSEHFGITEKNDVELTGKIAVIRPGFASIILKTNSTTPKSLQKIAKVNGKEDDIVGTMEIPSGKGGKELAGKVILEKISFVKMKETTNSAIEYSEKAVTIALGLIGIMAMWLGIMKIADEAGIIKIIAKMLQPVTKRLFPDVPSDHPAVGAIIMNLSANFLGLSNAATPFGLKAMEELDKLNENKGTATNAMCTFLAINTAGLTLIPATAIAIRSAMGSAQPAIIIGTSIFGSSCATIAGIISVKLFENFPLKTSKILTGVKQNLKVIAGFIFIASFIAILAISGALAGLSKVINPELLKDGIVLFSTLAIPVIILFFVLYGMYKKVKVYEAFIDGAKEGFNVAIRIIPYLVGMLMAIGIFRASGAMDWLIYLLNPLTNLIGMPAEALPMALMRPLSGSGALGIMSEVMSVHGTDSLIGIMTSTFYGSSETTFYVLAVYFGSVGIKNTRHALPAGLIADIAGMLGAVFIVKLIFG